MSIREKAYFERRVCYCCEKDIVTPHKFYSEMCESCGELNYQKRIQRIDLRNHHALVTGGRIKIGFETARLLLEMGADVTVTSRFPNDTLKRFQKLENFNQYQPRLHIIGADFRFVQSVQSVLECFKGKPLDILINNAAQTVRRPAPFYKHLLEAELQRPALENIVSSGIKVLADTKLNLPAQNKRLTSAETSQLALLPEDLITNEKIFPAGKYDKDGQQLDLRDNNSWMYELEDVSLVEMYEILQINLIAPFLLNTKLLPVLQQNKNKAFIINVSAMEGNFYAPRKHSRHPHTNKAKAALNMMTRTVAEHYKNLGVFMNSVDTGWITNEKPNPQNLGENERKSKMAIDETDGAMRVLDPIISALQNKEPQYGKLFKNYREYKW